MNDVWRQRGLKARRLDHWSCCGSIIRWDLEIILLYQHVGEINTVTDVMAGASRHTDKFILIDFTQNIRKKLLYLYIFKL